MKETNVGKDIKQRDPVSLLAGMRVVPQNMRKRTTV